jgi:hypothetical protein
MKKRKPSARATKPAKKAVATPRAKPESTPTGDEITRSSAFS